MNPSIQCCKAVFDVPKVRLLFRVSFLHFTAWVNVWNTDMSGTCFCEMQSLLVLDKKHKSVSKCRDLQLVLNAPSCLPSAQQV